MAESRKTYFFGPGGIEPPLYPPQGYGLPLSDGPPGKRMRLFLHKLLVFSKAACANFDPTGNRWYAGPLQIWIFPFPFGRVIMSAEKPSLPAHP